MQQNATKNFRYQWKDLRSISYRLPHKELTVTTLEYLVYQIHYKQHQIWFPEKCLLNGQIYCTVTYPLPAPAAESIDTPGTW